MGDNAGFSNTSSNAAQTTLRKSTSAVGWSGIMGEPSKMNVKHYGFHETAQGAVTKSGPVRSALQLAMMNSAHNDGGLTMSCSNRRHDATDVSMTSKDGNVSRNFSSTTSSTSTSVPRDVHDNNMHQGHGVFGGVFHRGFFSKPVVRSEEENYRYLMALDR
ncbi:hypothetical protein GCK32_011544 [Trichostrongylus colubriformis]|uniref:Uncharacterized protein n=1 Tax=Trichostrongylus colubriformis TaxID=6319 RepID=A0AAN8ESW0_TRICO